MTRLVTSACYFSFASFLRLTQSLVTNRLDIVGSNLLGTRLEISTCPFCLACSSLFLPFAISPALDPLFPRTPSDYLGALSLVTGWVDIRSICSSYSHLYFRLLSLFLLRPRYLSFLFLFDLRSLVLRLFRFLFLFFLSLFRFIYYADRNYSSSSLSPPSSAMVAIAGSAATEDSADPEMIVSFSVQ
jgi:hypothetical protein